MGLGETLIISRGEESSGGRQRPSALADAFEALVGAVFLDGGYEAAREFILRCFRDERLECCAAFRRRLCIARHEMHCCESRESRGGRLGGNERDSAPLDFCFRGPAEFQFDDCACGLGRRAENSRDLDP